jgi:hypothetical protein
MRHRTDIINTPAGWPSLTVRQEFVEGRFVYSGSVDGRPCVSSPSLEGAVQALLRRVLQRVIH